jgi:hypothetical protein
MSPASTLVADDMAARRRQNSARLNPIGVRSFQLRSRAASMQPPRVLVAYMAPNMFATRRGSA